MPCPLYHRKRIYGQKLGLRRSPWEPPPSDGTTLGASSSCPSERKACVTLSSNRTSRRRWSVRGEFFARRISCVLNSARAESVKTNLAASAVGNCSGKRPRAQSSKQLKAEAGVLDTYQIQDRTHRSSEEIDATEFVRLGMLKPT